MLMVGVLMLCQCINQTTTVACIGQEILHWFWGRSAILKIWPGIRATRWRQWLLVIVAGLVVPDLCEIRDRVRGQHQLVRWRRVGRCGVAIDSEQTSVGRGEGRWWRVLGQVKTAPRFALGTLCRWGRVVVVLVVVTSQVRGHRRCCCPGIICAQFLIPGFKFRFNQFHPYGGLSNVKQVRVSYRRMSNGVGSFVRIIRC